MFHICFQGIHVAEHHTKTTQIWDLVFCASCVQIDFGSHESSHQQSIGTTIGIIATDTVKAVPFEAMTAARAQKRQAHFVHHQVAVEGSEGVVVKGAYVAGSPAVAAAAATYASGVLAAFGVAVAVPAAAASVADAAYAVPAMAAAAVQVEFAAAPVVNAQAKAENSSMPAHVLLLAWLHGFP
jgi:hypothetical protein